MTFRELHHKCRHAASIEFDKAIPYGMPLMEEMENYLCNLFERLRNISVIGEKDQHRLPLIVSFIRTHMVINELLRCCENIEAATLVRKQLELLARYKATEKYGRTTTCDKEQKSPSNEQS